MNSFFRDVYKVVRKVPFGRVTSYGSIANYLGDPRGARVVGWAMNNSHNLKNFPAHRVVNRNGLLTGKNHFKGTNLMEQLLINEGIKIKNDQIINFDKFFWDPSKEL
tara:strand:+ start:1249 stop:1569 length:321 start_codon:yes stop_codon:yes gene_type:complete